MEDRHQAHVRETDYEKHQERNRRIILIGKGVEHNQSKIGAKAEFQDRQNARSPQILLCDPAIGFAFDTILGGSLETALDSKQGLDHSLRVTH